MYYTREAAQTALEALRPEAHPAVDPPVAVRQPEELNAKIQTFLSSAHVQILTGPWAMGWALDFHSRFVGDEWQRSPVGELLFRLKYQEERAVLPQLSQYVAALVADNPELNQIDLVTPTPPSAKRPFDAVQLLAELTANLLHKPVQSVITRVKSSAPQKEMRTLAQKQQNVAGAFACATAVQGQTILVVDDLFDSGATLAEITRLLKRHGAKCVYVLTITRTIHTD
jgi:competence protein ComFC